MYGTKTPYEIDHHRRRFLGVAAMTMAAAQLRMSSSAAARSSETKVDLPAIKPGTNTSFASLKQIDAGVLNVGYGFVTLPCRGREVSAPQELSGRCDRRPPRGHRRTAKHAVGLG